MQAASLPVASHCKQVATQACIRASCHYCCLLTTTHDLLSAASATLTLGDAIKDARHLWQPEVSAELTLTLTLTLTLILTLTLPLPLTLTRRRATRDLTLTLTLTPT